MTNKEKVQVLFSAQNAVDTLEEPQGWAICEHPKSGEISIWRDGTDETYVFDANGDEKGEFDNEAQQVLKAWLETDDDADFLGSIKIDSADMMPISETTI